MAPKNSDLDTKIVSITVSGTPVFESPRAIAPARNPIEWGAADPEWARERLFLPRRNWAWILRFRRSMNDPDLALAIWSATGQILAEQVPIGPGTIEPVSVNRCPHCGCETGMVTL